MIAALRRKFLLTILAILPARMTPAQEPAAAPQIPGAVAFEAREFQATDGGLLRYRLLRPLNYDPQQNFPLVLFLHGAGERGDENVRQLIHGGRNFADEALRRRHPAFVVVPQCPAEKRWVEVPWEDRKHAMPAEPSEPLRQTFELLDALQQEFSVDAVRIYGVGLSMGGFGVWDILQRKPDLLAAAIPICGGGDPAYAKTFVATPVWAFHGADDPVVTPDRSRDMIAALMAAGGHPIYAEYEGVQHDSWTQTFDNRAVWDWLFAQRKQSPRED